MDNQGFKPYVPVDKSMTEFTLRALVLGIIMTVILGAANAYLGLKAGMTIAATYPAAVISMFVLRFFKGSILEENFARTVGSIGESIAAGVIFTVPAFVILQLWEFNTWQDYVRTTALAIVGGFLGILFVAILRRVMVEDPDLKYPESVAAAEIHKAGQRGGQAAIQLFQAGIVGAVIKFLGDAKFFLASNSFFLPIGRIGTSLVRLGIKKTAYAVKAGGVTTFDAPCITPAYFGVGYIIGPELGALNFAGSLLAWGLMIPMIIFFLGPDLIGPFAQTNHMDPGNLETWEALVMSVWKFIIRPIAVGGMLVGACYTLFKMRKNLIAGLKRAGSDLKKSAEAKAATSRIDRDIDFKYVIAGLIAVFAAMVVVYFYFAGSIGGAVAAAIVMLITGFFFAAVSGTLVGMIGSSNNPVSGLTLSTLIVAAGVIVLIGVTGNQGIAAVLGVAGVGCVSAAVAGEMLQDLKVGHILGGTPWKMQTGNMIGGIFAAAIMFFPLLMLHKANITAGGIGFGDKALPAPQAGLMATLSSGIVGGEMAWPLVSAGIAMGIAMIMVKVRSPMLFAVGMYLPVETTFAIFIGGLIRWGTDSFARRRGFNDAQKARTENAGVLVASGLIAGEALMALVIATIVFFTKRGFWEQAIYQAPGYLPVAVALGLAAYMIFRPLSKAGKPDEPPPPLAVM